MTLDPTIPTTHDDDGAIAAEFLDAYAEYVACKNDPAHFINTYCWIHDGTDWISFELWFEQLEALDTIVAEQLVVILKSRQVGFTWLLLCIALWLMLFWPGFVVLLFSVGEREAKHHIDFRLKGIYRRLPPFLKERRDHATPESMGFTGKDSHNAKATFELSNGSFIQGFAKVGGDSYTAGFVIIDEADLNTRLSQLLAAVKATIDRGGKLCMMSRSSKERPGGEFKQTYRAARAGLNRWKPLFIPWYAAPDRDAAWYKAERADVLANTKSLDRLYEQYPTRDTEALAAPTLGKRLPPELINDPAIYIEQTPLTRSQIPGLHPELAALVTSGELRIYGLPAADRRDSPVAGGPAAKPREYRVGADPAEGLPDRDASAAAVCELQTGRFVAHLAGAYEPMEAFPRHLALLSNFYNNAPILVERNNHGHAVIGGLLALSAASAPTSTRDTGGEFAGLRRRILNGADGRPGWSQTPKANQVHMWSVVFSYLSSGSMVIHDFGVHQQLAAIDAKTLHHPNKDRDAAVDDEAYAAALATKARDLGGWRINA